jgi:hypothetical protein
MTKFLRVGVHHSNVSGYTSKAWTIGRTGSTVLLKWGSVEVAELAMADGFIGRVDRGKKQSAVVRRSGRETT